MIFFFTLMTSLNMLSPNIGTWVRTSTYVSWEDPMAHATINKNVVVNINLTYTKE